MASLTGARLCAVAISPTDRRSGTAWMLSDGDVRQKYCEMPVSVALVAAGLMSSTLLGIVTLLMTAVQRPLESGPRMAGTPMSVTRCVADRCAVVVSAESSHSTMTSGR